MRIALFGCGAMGRAAALAMVHDRAVKELVLVDINQKRLSEVGRWLSRHHAGAASECLCLDLRDAPALENILTRIDVVAAALPWPATASLIQAVTRTRRPLISITRPDYASFEAMNASVRLANGAVLIGCGVEPGLTEIFGRHVASATPRTQRLEIRCGGIPVVPRPPLNYRLLFGTQLPLAARDAYFVGDGRLIKTSRFEGHEQVFVEGVGLLEAYHDGLLPWFVDCDDVISPIPEITQKTLRWPGFANAAVLLGRLGLLDDEPVVVDGLAISPRTFTNAVLARQTGIDRDGADTTLLQVHATGVNGSDTVERALEVRVESDPTSGLTSMARATGFTLAAAIHLLAVGTVGVSGLMLAHEAVRGGAVNDLIAYLEARGIAVRQSSKSYQRAENREE